jgi:HPt (histidine-containing phosphotransfer) domain-containing protein
VFLDDAKRRVDAIEKGLEEQDGGSIQMAAHALKGSCSYLGATQLAELCRVMEVRAEEGDLDGGGEAVAQIREELATVSAVLTEEMKKA